MGISTSPTGAEPREWLVLFHERSTPWVEWFCPGRFKHVSAAAFVPASGAWVHLSWELARLRVAVIADRDFERWMALASEDAAVLRFPAPAFDTGPWQPRFALTCVSSVKHVVGVSSGALWPDGLWRFLVANGAEIVSDGKPVPAEGGRSGPEPRGARRVASG